MTPLIESGSIVTVKSDKYTAKPGGSQPKLTIEPTSPTQLAQCFEYTRQLAHHLEIPEKELTLTFPQLCQLARDKRFVFIQLESKAVIATTNRRCRQRLLRWFPSGMLLYHPIVSMQLGFGVSLEQWFIPGAFRQQGLGKFSLQQLCLLLTSNYATYLEVVMPLANIQIYAKLNFRNLTIKSPYYQLLELPIDKLDYFLVNLETFVNESIDSGYLETFRCLTCPFLPLTTCLHKEKLYDTHVQDGSIAKSTWRRPDNQLATVKWRSISLTNPEYEWGGTRFPAANLILFGFQERLDDDNYFYHLGYLSGWFLEQHTFNAWTGLNIRFSDFTEGGRIHLLGLMYRLKRWKSLLKTSHSMSLQTKPVGFEFVVPSQSQFLLEMLQEMGAENYSKKWSIGLLEGDALNEWRYNTLDGQQPRAEEWNQTKKEEKEEKECSSRNICRSAGC